MTDEVFAIPFKCGRDGEEWVARLEPVGPKFGFVGFQRPGAQVELPRPDREAAFHRRLQDLLSKPAPLPPPPHAELVNRERPAKLTDVDITDFGFECPTCHNTQTMLCPECKKYSCRGGVRDSAGRFQCQWCGTTLVFRPLTDKEMQQPPIPQDIESTTRRTELLYRELPPGEPDPELPPHERHGRRNV